MRRRSKAVRGIANCRTVERCRYRCSCLAASARREPTLTLNSLLAWPSISQRERNVLIQAHEEPGTTRDWEVFLLGRNDLGGIGCESEEVGSDTVLLRFWFRGAKRS